MNDITELGNAVKTNKNESVIYEICPGRDLFNQKSYEVNQLLVGKHGEKGFNYIACNNISTRLHYNRDGLHL